VEVSPGVFVSNVAPDDWQPDPEVGGDGHVLVRESDGFAGISRFTTPTAPIVFRLKARETLLILEGAATIEIDGGPTLDLRAGDFASLPEGAKTTWHLTTPFREVWFAPRAYEGG
jgi:uncharacterized cupin superfamily protein